jgi:hypothetical protein
MNEALEKSNLAVMRALTQSAAEEARLDYHDLYAAAVAIWTDTLGDNLMTYGTALRLAARALGAVKSASVEVAAAAIVNRVVQVEEHITAHHPRAARDPRLASLLNAIRDEAAPLTEARAESASPVGGAEAGEAG